MQEDLGPLEAWQIRGFPRTLRQLIIQEAKDRRMSPGEFATRIFVAARDAGWETGHAPAAPTAPPPSLLELTQAAIALAETQAPGFRGLAGQSRRAVRHRLAALAPAPQRLLQPPRRSDGHPAEVAPEHEPQQPIKIAAE